jgi:hypothetical protein
LRHLISALPSCTENGGKFGNDAAIIVNPIIRSRCCVERSVTLFICQMCITCCFSCSKVLKLCRRLFLHKPYMNTRPLQHDIRDEYSTCMSYHLISFDSYIGCVMASVLTFSWVDHVFKPQSCQTKYD